ncbi:MAG: ATP-binding protein [Bryobacteraceae bacterium]
MRESGLETPVVLLDWPGTRAETYAVMAAGVADVLSARELRRLPVTVMRETRAAEGRKERRNLEEQYRHSQKLEAVARLAGSVAHDFNNLLTIISGYSEMLLAGDSMSPDHRSSLEEIRRAALRGGTLTRQLLAFSRKQKLEVRVIRVNELLLEMNKLLRRLIREDIELVVLPAAVRDAVKTDAGQLEQVIMNMVVNARDAMPQGGKIVIEVSEATAGEGAPANLKPGDYVVLSISDTGVGMDNETLSHLFEPFFTTKPAGKGTGLGLAAAYGIVTQSGGAIAVESAPGAGTTMRIYLPRSAAQAQADAPGNAPCCARGCETILIVEDEPRLRKLLRSVLEEQGYEVLEAARGEEALRIARTHPSRIDLVILDVIMPELSGPEAWRQYAALRPESRALFMSGYADEALVHHHIIESGAPFLQKPFRPDELAGKVRELLDAGTRTAARERTASRSAVH